MAGLLSLENHFNDFRESSLLFKEQATLAQMSSELLEHNSHVMPGYM